MFFVGKLAKQVCPVPFSTSIGKKLFPCLVVTFLLMLFLPAAGWAATTATLGGSISAGTNTETDINNGGKTIQITLTGNTFAADVASTAAKRDLLFDNLVAGSESTEWSKAISGLKTAGLAAVSVSTTTATNDTITITLQNITASNYNISANQTISINIAPSLLADSSNPISTPPTFLITADREAVLSGTLKTSPTSSGIISGGKTITLTLTNDTWKTDVINIATTRDTLFDCFSATSGDATQWAKVVNALKATSNPATVLALSNNNSTLTITLPAVSDYDISVPQTITVTLDPSLITGGALPASQPTLNFPINPSFSTSTLTGTITSATETNIKNGGRTIIITLNDNTWLTDVVSNQTKLYALIDSFAATTDTTNWNLVKTELKDNPGSVVRTSGTILTITLPAVAGYNITADQTVTLNIPSLLLTNNYPVTITPSTFTITADKAAVVSGTATPSLTEADAVTGGKSIIITLTNDTWKSDVITDAAKREALIDGFTATGAAGDTAQWPSVISAIKASAVFTRVSDSVVSITLPPVASFNISGSLTVSLTVPATVVTSGAALPQVAAFTISQVTTQSATLSGSATSAATEANIAAGGKIIVITLANDVWATDVATNQGKREALIGGFAATLESGGTGADSDQWNTTVVSALKTASLSDSTVVVRTSDKVVTITLPPVAGFNIAGNIKVSLTIPQADLTTSSANVTASPSITISAITAVLSGTAISSPPDSTGIVTGGKTIVITLNNATWVSDVVTDHLSDLLGGFSSSDVASWNQIKNAILAAPANVTRTGNTVVTIKLPPVAGYSGSGQSVTLTIPQALITGANSSVTATNQLQIGSATSATLSGTILPSATKSDIVNGGKTIIITLSSGTWASDAVSSTSKRTVLLNGFAATSDTTNWNLVISALKASSTSVVRTSDTVITITLPPVANYDPIANQTINLTIPKSALAQSSADVTVATPLTITIPVYTSRGTLQDALTNGSLTNYMNNTPLQQIYIIVPKKYINTIEINHTLFGSSSVTSLDVVAEPEVAKVQATVNGAVSTASTSVPYNGKQKFTLGFTGLDTTKEITISVLNSSGNKLQSDTTKKITSGKKTYTETPTTSLAGSYTLYKLVTNSALLKNILKYYSLSDLTVSTP